MSPLLALLVILGGLAVLAYGGAATPELLKRWRFARIERRIARALKSEVRGRMVRSGKRPAFDGLSAESVECANAYPDARARTEPINARRPKQ